MTTSYRYLIGFVVTSTGRFATIELTLSEPIQSKAHVDVVQNDLRASFGTAHLLVLSFSAFADPAQTGDNR